MRFDGEDMKKLWKVLIVLNLVLNVLSLYVVSIGVRELSAFALARHEEIKQLQAGQAEIRDAIK